MLPIFLRPLVIRGRVEETSALMGRFWKEEPNHSFVHRTLLYAVLDDEAQIIATFEHATVREAMWAIDAAVLDPVFDRYRSSPQFQKLMKNVVAAR